MSFELVSITVSSRLMLPFINTVSNVLILLIDSSQAELESIDYPTNFEASLKYITQAGLSRVLRRVIMSSRVSIVKGFGSAQLHP